MASSRAMPHVHISVHRSSFASRWVTDTVVIRS